MRIILKVKANKELFDEWNTLGEAIQLLRGIMQNDMEIDLYQVAEWHMLALKLGNQLKELRHETYDYIISRMDVTDVSQ